MQIGRSRFGPAKIAWTDAAVPASSASETWSRLGDQQARRYAALRGIAAQRFLAGRALMLDLVCELTGDQDLGFTSTCERCGADHGRPRLEGAPVAVSLSYAGPMVAVAAVPFRDATAVGIDIERRPPGAVDEPLHDLANLFGSAGPPDIAQWTMLEAAVKADGRGIRIDLADVRIGAPSTGILPGSRAVALPGREKTMDAAQVAGPEGYVLSVAIPRPTRPRRAARSVNQPGSWAAPGVV